MLEKRIWQNDLNTRGNNVVSVSSVTDKVTGAPKLTPMTIDAVTGESLSIQASGVALDALIVAR